VVDRELYLPRSWTDDRKRCRAAGVPSQVGFATKPKLATRMITRALDAGVPAGWVAGDEVYGANPGLRAELEARQIGYVLAVACDHRVGFGGATQRADALLRRVPARAWQQISCGKGAKGHRLYQWAFLRLDHDHPAPDGQAGTHWLMIRRNHKTGELAYYRCYTPRPTPLAVLVKVAGRRWTIEERFQTGKGLCGLDQHQVRRWRSWYRWATLAMLAHAFLVVAAVTEHARHPPPSGLIGLTCNELQHPVCGTGHPARRRCRPPAALVGVAPPPPSTRPYLPLPATGRLATMKITNYGWSTRALAKRGRERCRDRGPPPPARRAAPPGEATRVPPCRSCAPGAAEQRASPASAGRSSW
jgi:hypothetical protein